MDGQQVLYGDGHVGWSQTPYCGVQNDNIYTASQFHDDAAATPAGPLSPRVQSDPDPLAPPTHAADTVLLPAAELVEMTGHGMPIAISAMGVIPLAAGVLIVLAWRNRKQLSNDSHE